MRKIVIFTIIVTLISATAGCTAHNEPNKKADKSSSANVVIHTTQAEKLPEKQKPKQLRKAHLRNKQHSRLSLILILKRCQKSRLFLKSQQQILSQSKIPKGKKKRPKAKYMSLKLQQILLRKSQQQLNKLKDLIYRIGFLMHRIMLKV